MSEDLCALNFKGKNVCTSRKNLMQVVDFLCKSGTCREEAKKMSDEELIKLAMEKLGVKNELEIYKHHLVKQKLGNDKSNKILKKYFKVHGPSDSNELLSNFNIDDVLEQWSLRSDEFGKKFYHIGFQMIDFEKYGGELAYIDPVALRKDGYDCFGVVLNTDVSTGRGKHWFCLYGDLRAKPIRIEFFNSSGNQPRREIRQWFERLYMKMKKKYNKEIELLISSTERLQYSETECGMWTLGYVLSRLKDKPFNWFIVSYIKDDEIYALRRDIFMRHKK